MRQTCKQLIVLAAVLASTTAADADWKLRLAGEGLFPSGTATVEDSPGLLVIEPQDSTGFAIEAEIDLPGRWGLAAGLGSSTAEISVSFLPPVPNIDSPVTASDTLVQAWIGPRWYLVDKSSAQIALGFGAHYLDAFAFDFPALGTTAEVGDEVALGWIISGDFGGNRTPWFGHASIGYIDSSFEIREGPVIDFEPTVIRVGLGRRFSGK